MRLDILDVLQLMIRLNRETVAPLSGGAYAANFEPPGEEGAWVQAKLGVMNVAYPYVDDPDVVLKTRGLACLPQVAFPAWVANRYLTLTFGDIETNEYAAFIDRVFRDLYELPEGYPLSAGIIDLR